MLDGAFGMTGSLADVCPDLAARARRSDRHHRRRYVRLIECERVPNAVTADPATLATIERAYANVCRTIPDHQGIVVYAQTDPFPMRGARRRSRAHPGGRARRSCRRPS